MIFLKHQYKTEVFYLVPIVHFKGICNLDISYTSTFASVSVGK